MVFRAVFNTLWHHMGRDKRIWYLSPMRAAKVQASLHIRAVSPEPPLLAHTSSESRATVRQKARSLAPLNGWACAVTICHDGMLKDTNSLDVAHIILFLCQLMPFSAFSKKKILVSGIMKFQCQSHLLEISLQVTKFLYAFVMII